MATRLYLPSNGTPPLPSLGVKGVGWDARTNELVRLPCAVAKTNKALTDRQIIWWTTTSVDWIWWQFQSPPLAAGYSWTTSEIISLILRGLEEATTVDSKLSVMVTIVSGDGATVRGYLKSRVSGPGNEFATTAKTRTFYQYQDEAFSSLVGDRLIIEVGPQGLTPTLKYVTMRIGDPSATSDFAFTEDLTTDLCPWVEFTKTVAFSGEGESHSGSAAISGNGSVIGAVQKGGRGSALTSGKGALVAIGIAAMMGVASLSGGGSQIATGLKAAQNIAVISDGGSVTATGAKDVEQHSGSAIISGNGAVLPAGKKGGQSLVAISGNGTLATSKIKAAFSIAAISGKGSVSGVGLKAGSGAAGLVSANGSQITVGKKAALAAIAIPGDGSLITTGANQRFGSPIITSGGILTATGYAGGKTHSGIGVISGGGVLVGLGEKSVGGAGSISAKGTLTGIESKSAQGIAAISGGGSLTAISWRLVLELTSGIKKVENLESKIDKSIEKTSIIKKEVSFDSSVTRILDRKSSLSEED